MHDQVEVKLFDSSYFKQVSSVRAILTQFKLLMLSGQVRGSIEDLIRMLFDTMR